MSSTWKRIQLEKAKQLHCQPWRWYLVISVFVVFCAWSKYQLEKKVMILLLSIRYLMKSIGRNSHTLRKVSRILGSQWNDQARDACDNTLTKKIRESENQKQSMIKPYQNLRAAGWFEGHTRTPWLGPVPHETIEAWPAQPCVAPTSVIHYRVNHWAHDLRSIYLAINSFWTIVDTASAVSFPPMLLIQWSARQTWSSFRLPKSVLIAWITRRIRSCCSLSMTEAKR